MCVHACAAENKVTAGRVGAIEAVVAGMQRHVDVAGVQEQCAWAIINMTQNNASKCLIMVR